MSKYTLLELATDGNPIEQLSGWRKIPYRPQPDYEDFTAHSTIIRYIDDDPNSFVGQCPDVEWPEQGVYIVEAEDITVVDDSGAGAYNVLAMVMCNPGRITIKSFLGECDRYDYRASEVNELLCMVYYKDGAISEVFPMKSPGHASNQLCRCLNMTAWALDALLYNLPKIRLPRVDYYEYLKSDAWKVRRVVALDRADGHCQVCNSTDNLNVHHRTYARLGHEEPEDLTVLCADCHKLFHDNGRLAK